MSNVTSRTAAPKIGELLQFSNVRSILQYAYPVWDPQTKVLSDMLKLVQNHAARFVSTNYNFTSRCHYPYGWAGNGIIKQAQKKKAIRNAFQILLGHG